MATVRQFTMALNVYATCGTGHSQGHRTGKTGGLNTRYGTDALLKLPIERLRPRIVVGDLVGVQQDIQEMIRMEAQIHVLGAVQATQTGQQPPAT